MGLAEERRVHDAIGCAQIDDVEDVQGRSDQGEAVSAWNRGIDADLGLTATEPAAADVRIGLWPVCSGGAFGFGSDSEDLADANVEDHVRGADAKVIGDDLLAQAYRICIETTECGGDYVGSAASAEGGSGVELIVGG